MAVAVVVATSVAACSQPTPVERAIDSAHTSWVDADRSIKEVLPSLPDGDFREYILEAGSLGESASLIGVDETTVREFAYQLQSQTSYVLDASQSGSIATALIYFAGSYEGGGGVQYDREVVFTCAQVKIDLAENEVLGYEGSPCNASIYAVMGPAGELDFEKIAPPA